MNIESNVLRTSIAEDATPVVTPKDKPAQGADLNSESNQNEKTNAAVDTGSFMSHVWYGLGGVLFVAVPPFIPGVTIRELVILYVGITVAVYSLVCILGIIKGLRPVKPERTRRF